MCVCVLVFWTILKLFSLLVHLQHGSPTFLDVTAKTALNSVQHVSKMLHKTKPASPAIINYAKVFFLALLEKKEVNASYNT